MIEIERIHGIGEFLVEDLAETENKVSAGKIYKIPAGKAFLVVNMKNETEVHTVEVRTDGNLAKLLKEKYESVMDSRYFGRGGIEIVMSGQLDDNEIEDLIRLSYNMTAKE